MKKPKKWLVIPFFVVLAVLCVISFILPLRPTVSYAEKRKLAEFPAFSFEDLMSGKYFSDISLWYSDTFPGREGWLETAQDINSLHGYGELSFYGDLPEVEAVPEIPAPTRPPETTVPPTTAPAQDVPEEATEAVEVTESTEAAETEPATEAPGKPGDAELIYGNAVIQLGDAAYNPVGFSQRTSDQYAAVVSFLASEMKEKGGRVVSAPAPNAVGVMVEPEMASMMKSADLQEVLNYLHGSVSEDVITVETVAALKPHKDEYLFFHSDHHWTADGAYYSYQAICEALGMESAQREGFDLLEQGEFVGTLYGKCANPKKLAADYVNAYVPRGDVSMRVFVNKYDSYEFPVIQDMRSSNVGSKYSGFCGADNPMLCITNEANEGKPNCLIIKDSFGNCIVPFFTQNYYKVYAVDYREYYFKTMMEIVDDYEIQDVIFSPNIMATQSEAGLECLRSLVNYH